VKQQIDSFNYLVNHDMRNIVMAKGNQKILSEVDPDWYMKYLDIRVERPCTLEQYMTRRITPHECRLRDMTYSAPIKARGGAQRFWRGLGGRWRRRARQEQARRADGAGLKQGVQ